MPARTRSGRRNDTKRIILGAVSENESVIRNENSNSTNTGLPSVAEPHAKQRIANAVHSGKSFEIPTDFDGSSSESVKIILQDIEHKVKKLQESIRTKNSMAVEEQKEIYFVAMMNVPKDIKNMTIREFNRKYLEEGENIISLIRDIADEASLIGDVADEVNSNNACMNKKRVRTGINDTVKNATTTELETPLRNIRSAEFRTPGTLARTVKRGEILYSINGSPVDQASEGDLVATVSKKRRGNDAAAFDINIGDGRYISLSDPSSVQHLDPEMISTAKTQLKVMQDQMTMLMAKLGN